MKNNTLTAEKIPQFPTTVTGTNEKYNVTALLKLWQFVCPLNDAFVNMCLCRVQNKNSLCGYALSRKSSRQRKQRNVSPSV